MHRVWQSLLIATFLPLCWLGMMGVHESGHATAARLSGGRVERVVLHPLRFSRTDVSPNPHPLLVAWAGPIVGANLPLLVWAALAGARARGLALVRFFAGFCLVANGAYLLGGAVYPAGDAADLLSFGAAPWQLAAFGGAALALGLVLWHNTGRAFGLGRAGSRVSRAAATVSAALLFVLIAIELLTHAG